MRWLLFSLCIAAVGCQATVADPEKVAVVATTSIIADAVREVGGDRVAVFPEGTTTAGDRLLRFHAALLQPAIACAGIVHPVTIQYFDAHGERSPSVSYIGDESLVGSVWQLLGAQTVVACLRFDPPEPAAGRHRRELADCLHATINRRLGFGIPDREPGTSGHLQPARH